MARAARRLQKTQSRHQSGRVGLLGLEPISSSPSSRPLLVATPRPGRVQVPPMTLATSLFLLSCLVPAPRTSSCRRGRPSCRRRRRCSARTASSSASAATFRMWWGRRLEPRRSCRRWALVSGDGPADRGGRQACSRQGDDGPDGRRSAVRNGCDGAGAAIPAGSYRSVRQHARSSMRWST